MVQTPFMNALLSGHAEAVSGTAWFDQLRSAALERANAASVPTTRDEEWRFTDLGSLARLTFQPAEAAAPVSSEAIGKHYLPEASARLVFVDGIFASGLSQLPAVAGVRILRLKEALKTHAAALEKHLARSTLPAASIFAGLNTAFMREATVLMVEANASVDAPVHILHLATRREQAHAVYPRTLVIAGRNSRCAVIEDFFALGEGPYFSAPVTEVNLEAGAAVSHIRLQREAVEAYQLGHCSVQQHAASRYGLISVALGARLSRLDLQVLHGGPGCETTIDGLAFIGGRQLADTHSSVDHSHPQGKLRQAYKSVVGGGAHAVFNGKILVREGAQQTDAGQSCRGLLLSDRAHIDAKPQLEIFADDVKCAHGAAIGQLDPEEMFYLRSRGLSEGRARNLLTYAFAAEIIERIPVASLRSRLAHVILERTQESA